MQPAEFRPAQNYDTNPYYDNAEWPGPGYVEPTGTIEITENGEVDVTQYAKADVNVESGDGGGGTSTHDITCYYVDPQTYELTLIDGIVHSTTIIDGHYDSTDTPVQTADAGSVLIAEMCTPSGLATCTPMGYGTANAESPMYADIIIIGDFSSEYIFVMPDADVVVFYSVNPEQS